MFWVLSWAEDWLIAANPASFSPTSAFITFCQDWHLPKALLFNVVLDNLHWYSCLIFIIIVFFCCGGTAMLFGFYGTTQLSHLRKGIDLVGSRLFEYLMLLLWFEAYLSLCIFTVDIWCYHNVSFGSCWSFHSEVLGSIRLFLFSFKWIKRKWQMSMQVCTCFITLSVDV